MLAETSITYCARTFGERAEEQREEPCFTGNLDDLLQLDAETLGRMYETARVPRLSDVTGDLRGRMLALPALGGVVAGAVRAFASSRAFPWKGKSFRAMPANEERGDGINRVVLDRWRLYRFETFVGKSLAGDFDAVQLDYDNEDNPFFIRPIRDEIREIAKGLYLGQAYFKTAKDAHLVLYFALSKAAG